MTKEKLLKQQFTKLGRRFLIKSGAFVLLSCIILGSGFGLIYRAVNSPGLRLPKSTKAWDSLIVESPMSESSETKYELEAKLDKMWRNGIVFARPGDLVEIRLKASSDQVDQISSEAIYRNGLSIASFHGLDWAESDDYKAFMLPDGTLTSYMENGFDPATQYYRIGTFQLNWGDWLYHDVIPTVKVWKHDEFEATLPIMPPYDLPMLRAGLALLLIGGALAVVVPTIYGVGWIVLYKRFANKD